MTQVAHYYGQPFMCVWREPYHETLFAFAGLVQRRRIEGLLDEARRVRDAQLANYAFASPKDLDKARADLMARLRRVPGIERRTESAADLVARFAHLQPAPDGD